MSGKVLKIFSSPNLMNLKQDYSWKNVIFQIFSRLICHKDFEIYSSIYVQCKSLKILSFLSYYHKLIVKIKEQEGKYWSLYAR